MPVRRKIERKQKLLLAAGAVALALVLLVVGIVVGTRSRAVEFYDFQKDVAHGIDVSEHNGEIDWQTVAENADFAFIRVGYRGWGTGSLNEDALAAENLKGAHRAGIPYGVYFYSQAVTPEEARAEAELVLKLIRRYPPALPVVIDFEYPTDEDGLRTGRLHEAGLTTAENTAILNAFCETVEEAGYAAGIYASSSVLHGNIDTAALADTAAVWVADYNETVGYDVRYKIRQYTRTGSCPGVSSQYVDWNYYYSTIQKGE